MKRREAQRDPSTVAGLLADANKILRQNGFTLAQSGQTRFADNDAWLNPSTATAAAEYDFDDLMDSSANTGGVELYFVQTITSAQGTASRGVRRAKGIAIASSGDALTVAHEVLHACGLADIYPQITVYPQNEKISIPDASAQAMLPAALSRTSTALSASVTRATLPVPASADPAATVRRGSDGNVSVPSIRDTPASTVAALLITKVPPSTDTGPVALRVPVSVSVPAPFLVMPPSSPAAFFSSGVTLTSFPSVSTTNPFAVSRTSSNALTSSPAAAAFNVPPSNSTSLAAAALYSYTLLTFNTPSPESVRRATQPTSPPSYRFPPFKSSTPPDTSTVPD